MTFSSGIHPPLVEFRSMDLEKRCISELCRLIQQHLDSYGTTLEEDELLLKGELPVNARNCVLLRAEEKRLLLRGLKTEKLFDKITKARKVKKKTMVESSEYSSLRRYFEKILSI